MAEIKRITPEEVLKAFTENNLVPIQENYAEMYDDKKCTCGLSSLVIANGGNFEFIFSLEFKEGFVLDKMASEGFGRDYLIGFIIGFDGNRGTEIETVGFLQGKEDGKAAWEAVKHLAVVE